MFFCSLVFHWKKQKQQKTWTPNNEKHIFHRSQTLEKTFFCWFQTSKTSPVQPFDAWLRMCIRWMPYRQRPAVVKRRWWGLARKPAGTRVWSNTWTRTSNVWVLFNLCFTSEKSVVLLSTVRLRVLTTRLAPESETTQLISVPPLSGQGEAC